MLENLINAIEKTGVNDPLYDEKQRSIDALETFERMLAYGIATLCPDKETIREVCEDSAFTIKKIALAFAEINITHAKQEGQVPPSKVIKANTGYHNNKVNS